MSSALIHIDLATLRAATTPECQALIEKALECSALISRVQDAESNTLAVAAQRELKAILAAIEKARKAAKEPVLDLGRAIDAAAEKAKAELILEDSRVSGLICNFAAAELAKQRAAENAARLAVEAAERQRQEELRKAEEARRIEEAKLREQERKAAEAIAKSKSDEARAKAEKAQAEIKRQQEIAAAANLEAIDKINEEASRKNYEASQLALAAQPVQAAGQIVKTDWEIQVVNPYELAKFHPNCVKIEPRLIEIKELLNAGIQVRGVEAKKITKASVRTQAKEVDAA